MGGVDLHQHLWPPAFQTALRARTRPPLLDGAELVTQEGRFPFHPIAHDPEHRISELDRDELETAVLSLQPTLGIEGLPDAERRELEATWVEAIGEVVEGSAGRFRALAPWRLPDGLAGTSVGASAVVDPESASTLLDGVDAAGGVLFVHPECELPPTPDHPEWWSWTAGYTAQMQRAYLAWLASGRVRWPSIRVVFAILAGGAPFQLERLAHRGIDVRSALDPNVFLDVSTYGRRAIELCVETFGVQQLVYGSDTPVVDPRPTLTAVRGFGDAVARILQIETPGRLLA